MTHFVRNGNTWSVSDDRAMEIRDKLPPGNYVIKQDQFGNMFLEEIDGFQKISKRYGDNDRRCDRIFSTFASRAVSTGVLLTGEKGSGKTLLAKSLAIRCHEEGIPCIVINSPWRGDAFNKLLQDIEQPCMVLFDEFEKVYDRDEQTSILTLLDGVFPSKKLFVLTCNDKWRIDEHMRNRPGRIYYMMDYKGLTDEFVREYCKDNLVNQAHTEGVCMVGSVFAMFNFDMLKAMVEEMNRYGETAQEVLDMLNIRPEFENSSRYSMKITLAGEDEPLGSKQLSCSHYNGNPMNDRVISYTYDPDPEDAAGEYDEVEFFQNDLKKVEPREGKFVYINAQGHKMVLEREKQTSYNWYNAF